jgi:hypothetical protein
MSPSKRLSLWLPEELITKIRARGDQSESIREGLTRYYAMLDYERKQLKFAVAELSLLADICNGTMFVGGMLPLGLLADAEDTENCIYEKWAVKREILLSKLRALTVCQEAAVVDAIERFWAASEHVSTVNPGDLLK